MLKILTLLVLPSLLITAEAKGRGGGRGGKGFLFLCFGEGCSGLDLTLTCLSVLLTMCCCISACASCSNESVKEEEETEMSNQAANQQRLLLVWIKQQMLLLVWNKQQKIRQNILSLFYHVCFPLLMWRWLHGLGRKKKEDRGLSNNRCGTM